MANCEKCWNDAYTRSRCNGKDQVENYQELIEERDACSPEEQAGQDATLCPNCKIKSVHQYAKVCMNGCGYKKGDGRQDIC